MGGPGISHPPPPPQIFPLHNYKLYNILCIRLPSLEFCAPMRATPMSKTLYETLNVLMLYFIFVQTVVCVVMGGTVYWLIRKIGPDVGAYFDAKSQVSGPL